MQFEFTGPQTELEEMFGGQHCINAFGRIEPGDCDRFLEFVERTQPPPRSELYISSEGGSVDDAMKIGILIRSGWFSTNVGMRYLAPSDEESLFKTRLHTHKYCMSAATLMYLGGRLRYLDDDANFGVHQFSFTNPGADSLSESQKLSADIAYFIAEMGIRPEFLALSAATASDNIEIIEKEKLENLGVVTGGQTAVEWTTQARNGVIYVRGERDSLFGHHKLMLSRLPNGDFFVHAVIETQGRREELLSFGLVEITLNNESTRIDLSQRCTREERGIYINIIAPVTYEEADLIANSSDFGLQARFSKEADLFLGIGGMDTSDGKEQLQTLVASSK